MIQSREISVVIQGAIGPETTILTRSIRQYLPDAEIVVSTWEGSDVSTLDYDRLVLNEDPGAISASTNEKRAFNLNRQIVSSSNGVKEASRPYVLKCRSDMELLGDGFLTFWDMYPKRDAAYEFASHKLLIPSLYTIKGEEVGGKLHPSPYHTSDWYVFGRQEDVLEFVSPPLVDDEFSTYFAVHPKPRDYAILWLNERYWKFSPEQYFGVMYAKKFLKNLDFPNVLEFDHVDFEQAERFMVNNFTVVEPMEFQMVLDKGPYYNMSRDLSFCPPHVQKTMYRRYVYELDYQKYCDPSFQPKPNDWAATADNQYLQNMVALCEACKSDHQGEEYDFAIITPTYRGHFPFIPKYLDSFRRYVKDQQHVPIYFIVERAEFFDFTQIVIPYLDHIPIHVLIFEDILLKFGIRSKPSALLKKYGRFTFQTLKKLYAMLYTNKSRYLVLDSESVWARPTVMKEEYEAFFQEPFIPYSPLSIQKKDNLGNLATRNIDFLLEYTTGNWYLECFSWYYDRKILTDLFERYGMPMEMAEKVYQRDKEKGQEVGIFEILLYTIYIEKYNQEYQYRLVDIYTEIMHRLPRNVFLNYNQKVMELYRGESGFAEHIALTLTKYNWKILANYYRENRLDIIRFETFNRHEFKWQRRFLAKANTCILAASQDHWFVTRPSWLRSMILEQIGQNSIRSIARRIMKQVLPAYRASYEAREMIMHLHGDMIRQFDHSRWQTVWNDACANQQLECTSWDVLYAQKLDVTDWLTAFFGQKWFQDKRILLVDAIYGDWAVPFLSLHAQVDFLVYRVETKDVMKRRFPASKLYFTAEFVQKKPEKYDLILDFSQMIRNNQSFIMLREYGQYYMGVEKIETEKKTTQESKAVAVPMDQVNVLAQKEYGFCSKIGEDAQKFRFIMYQLKK